jgi:hypothetical protein
MGLLLLEVLGALLILVFIVWWTMFHGRDKGEPQDTRPHGSHGSSDGAATNTAAIGGPHGRSKAAGRNDGQAGGRDDGGGA